MENEITVDGFGISTSVVETIVALSVTEVKGVAGIGTPDTISGLMSVFANPKNTPSSSGVNARTLEDGRLVIDIRMQVYYGYRIVEVAADVRAAVADAVLSQLGIEVAAVDIFVDGVVFSETE
ncbi:MAG: Asp23/Gls24 family envelope stress response protein [Coriobacteriales bacterium]